MRTLLASRPPREGVSDNVQRANNILDLEIQSLEFLYPTSLTLRQKRQTTYADQRFVIGVHNTLLLINVRPKLHTCREQRKKFFIPGAIVTLSCKVLVRMVANRVQTVRILLQQDTTNCQLAGVTLGNELLGEIRQPQHWSIAQRMFQRFKRCLLLFPPRKRYLGR